MSKHIGVLAAGGDSPGLNAAIRGLEGGYTFLSDGWHRLSRWLSRLDGKSHCTARYYQAFRHYYRRRYLLGTNRDKPHRMPVGDKLMDMTDVIVANYENHHLDAPVCLGGGGTQKNALRLKKAGLNIVTQPKTIDNDVA